MPTKEGKELVKLALETIAKITGINIEESEKAVRRNPLFDEEIHIEEELINLEEAIKAYRMAIDSKALRQYPHLKRPLLRECRASLVHAVGLVARMLKKEALPREYSEEDTRFALQKIIRLIVADIQRTKMRLSGETIEILRPFMTFRQQLAYRQEHQFNPLGYVRILRRMFATA